VAARGSGAAAAGNVARRCCQRAVKNVAALCRLSEGLAELGYEEGRSFSFEFVQAPNIEGYATAFQEIARRNVDILMATGPETNLKAAIAVAGTRPIVMIAVDFDPLARGYVASLARPGGNITGLFLEQIQLSVKRLELLKESFPKLSGATVFWDQVSADQWRALERAAATAKFHVSGIEFHKRITSGRLPWRRQITVTP
jgi:putative tryptophan/tyrosine transport system substrate-binding protein